MYAYLMNIIKFYIIHSINEVQAFLVVYSELIDRKRLISKHIRDCFLRMWLNPRIEQFFSA